MESCVLLWSHIHDVALLDTFPDEVRPLTTYTEWGKSKEVICFICVISIESNQLGSSHRVHRRLKFYRRFLFKAFSSIIAIAYVSLLFCYCFLVQKVQHQICKIYSWIFGYFISIQKVCIDWYSVLHYEMWGVWRTLPSSIHQSGPEVCIHRVTSAAIRRCTFYVSGHNKRGLP